MKRLLLLLGITATLSACVSPQKIPPVSPTPADEAFVWHDLASHTPESSKQFYSDLFGWDFKKIDASYSLILDGKIRVGGLIHSDETNPGQQSSVWLCTVEVTDIHQTVEKIKAHGGEILREPELIPDRGTLALFADPNGAILALLENPLQQQAGDPTNWIWHELVTEDAKSASAWYADVFEMTAEKSEDGKRFILTHESKTIASVSENPFEETRNQWIPVLAVENFAEALAKVESRGGKLLLPPSEKLQQGKLALILDPSEAPIVIQNKGAAQ
ncbi:VOC family protein [Kiritimatiellaeota bacterium B1221]|nr:VOC family protein [Kiritimatiellaeota bacterium B1221]